MAALAEVQGEAADKLCFIECIIHRRGSSIFQLFSLAIPVPSPPL